MKSLSDTQPFFGCASAPVDVQRYVDGRLQFPPDDAVVVVAAAVLVVVAIVVILVVVAVVPPPLQGRHWE